MNNLEQHIRHACEAQKAEDLTNPQLDQIILEAVFPHLPPRTQPAISIWRRIMQPTITKYAVAIMIVLGVLSVSLFNKTASEAYAIDQTIDAMDTIHTVYFKVELFKQGSAECWMQFDSMHNKPTHLCLFMTGFPIYKVDSPEGSFVYNKTTHRYMLTRRDERNKNWYINFAEFFRQSLKMAKHNKNVEIFQRADDAFGKDMIVIRMDEKGRIVEYLIDPESKLPMRFTTLEVSDVMPYFRQTLAVRNMSEIAYNQAAPEGLFAIPADAQLMTNEHDIYVRPDAGMPVDGMTNEQACEKIVQSVAEAMNGRDWERVGRLMFPFGTPPKEYLNKLPEDLSQPLMEILELGKPYERDGYWYIPSRSREYGGKVKEEQVPIKFYEFDGKRSCMIMWED